MFLLPTLNFSSFKYINYSHIALIICSQPLFLDTHDPLRKSGVPDQIWNLQRMVRFLVLSKHWVLNKCLLKEGYSGPFRRSLCSSCSRSSVWVQSRGQGTRPSGTSIWEEGPAFSGIWAPWWRCAGLREACRVGKDSRSSTKADREVWKCVSCLGNGSGLEWLTAGQ